MDALLDVSPRLCYTRDMQNKQRDEERLTIRFPGDIIRAMREAARAHDRSLNGEIIWALRQYVAQLKQADVKAS